MNSFTLVAGTLGCTVRMLMYFAMVLMKVKSLIGSKGILRLRAGPMVWVVPEAIPRV